MRRAAIRWSFVLGLAMALSMAAIPAQADHATRPHTKNMHAKGHSPHPATFLGEPDGVRHVSSDLAFWGKLAFNGNYDGWRVIDISDPDNPRSSPIRPATATRVISSSGRTSWSGRGTHPRPPPGPVSTRQCRRAGKAFTSSTSATR